MARPCGRGCRGRGARGRRVRLLVRIPPRGAQGFRAHPGAPRRARRPGRARDLLHGQPRHVGDGLPRARMRRGDTHRTGGAGALRPAPLRGARRQHERGPQADASVHERGVPLADAAVALLAACAPRPGGALRPLVERLVAPPPRGGPGRRLAHRAAHRLRPRLCPHPSRGGLLRLRPHARDYREPGLRTLHLGSWEREPVYAVLDAAGGLRLETFDLP